MTRPAEPPYTAAYREADRLAACLLLDADRLKPSAAQQLDAQHRAALRVAQHGEYVELCDLTVSLEDCIERDGPEMWATGETDCLEQMNGAARALSERLCELYQLGRTEGWL